MRATNPLRMQEKSLPARPRAGIWWCFLQFLHHGAIVGLGQLPKDDENVVFSL